MKLIQRGLFRLCFSTIVLIKIKTRYILKKAVLNPSPLVVIKKIICFGRVTLPLPSRRSCLCFWHFNNEITLIFWLQLILIILDVVISHITIKWAQHCCLGIGSACWPHKQGHLNGVNKFSYISCPDQHRATHSSSFTCPGLQSALRSLRDFWLVDGSSIIVNPPWTLPGLLELLKMLIFLRFSNWSGEHADNKKWISLVRWKCIFLFSFSKI